jgi:transcription elongation factor GreA
MTDVTYLTPEGMHKLDDELTHLRTVRREEVAARLREALEDGDLLENAAYENAKNEQAFIEGRIQKLESQLANAVLIDHHHQTGECNLARKW